MTFPVQQTPRRAQPRRRRRGLRLLAFLGVLVVVAGGLAGWAWWNGSIGSMPIREHCTAIASGTAVRVDPEQAGNAAVITGIAVRRNLPARAASIGITTAIQESKLRNIDYGDRDSLGLFQQRPSQGWGTPEQIQDPVYSTNAFYDRLVKIDGYEDMVITEVAQAVQISAFPNAYADHEPEGRTLASALSGYSAGGFSCVLREPDGLAAQPPGEGGLTPRAAAVVSAAAAETGRRDAEAAGEAGTGVRFTVPAGEDNRLAWSLAGWAVARAEALDVVAVSVAGQRWSRESSTDGWTARSEALPAGQVLIEVA